MASSEFSLLRSVTSSSWLRRVPVREPQAWRWWTELDGALVFHSGRRRGLSAEVAGDLVQEVFSALAGAVERFLHSLEFGTFRGWLWTIARGIRRDLFRDAAARKQADGGTAAWQRLSTVEQLDMTAVTTHLGVSANSVRQAKSRVLRRLRVELGDGAAGGSR